MEQLHEVYPCSDKMASTDEAMAFLPQSLRVMLKTLAEGKNVNKKVASLGQAIMQSI